MNIAMKKIALICALLLIAVPAFAMTLDQAKNAGLVGERNDGYLGFVGAAFDPALSELVADINKKRLQKFTEVSAESGASLEQVHIRFYHRAVEMTAPGNYYMDQDGNWKRK